MRAKQFITEDFRILGQPAEIGNTLPALKMAKLAGQAGFYSVKSYLDDLRVKNPQAWARAMQDGAPETMDDWKKPIRLPSDTGVDPKYQYTKSKPVPNESIKEDWNKVNHHDKTDGLSQKAVNAYRRENPGSKLKTAVTTKPSKLKAGSKAAKRRKSFCARMSGNKGPMKKPNGKPTPKALALRRWNCESVEEMQELIQLGESYIANLKENFSDGKHPGRNSQLNTLHDPQRMAGAVAYLTDYYDSKEEAYRIIDAYMASVDKLITQGGTVYRAVWVAPGQKPKLKQPGLHWTLTPQSAEEYLQSEAGEYAAMDMDLDDQPHAYILSATVGPNNITNHGVNFAQQHHEQEVRIVDPKQAQIKVVKQVGMTENFADGRNPQDKGDSKRHGINTKASVSSLRKTAKQGGRKGQLAHWMANMKAGKAKNAGK